MQQMYMYMYIKINMYAGKQEPLLSVIKRSKLALYGHATRHDSLPKMILQGTVNGSRKIGGHRKTWIDNVKEWTSLSVSTLLSSAERREQWMTVW
jgi:hypothetical protein